MNEANEIRFWSDVADMGDIKLPELQPGDESIYVSITHSDGGVAFRKLTDDIRAMEADSERVE